MVIAVGSADGSYLTAEVCAHEKYQPTREQRCVGRNEEVPDLPPLDAFIPTNTVPTISIKTYKVLLIQCLFCYIS